MWRITKDLSKYLTHERDYYSTEIRTRCVSMRELKAKAGTKVDEYRYR